MDRLLLRYYDLFGTVSQCEEGLNLSAIWEELLSPKKDLQAEKGQCCMFKWLTRYTFIFNSY